MPKTLNVKLDHERELNISEVRCKCCGDITQLSKDRISAIAKLSAEQIKTLLNDRKKQTGLYIIRTILTGWKATLSRDCLQQWRVAAYEDSLQLRMDRQKNQEMMLMLHETRKLTALEAMSRVMKCWDLDLMRRALCALQIQIALGCTKANATLHATTDVAMMGASEKIGRRQQKSAARILDTTFRFACWSDCCMTHGAVMQALGSFTHAELYHPVAKVCSTCKTLGRNGEANSSFHSKI